MHISVRAVGATFRLSILSLLVAGCGSPPPDGGAVLHRGNGPDPGTLDPQRRQDEPAGHILRDLYEGLVIEGPDGELRPGVAQDWTYTEDGRVLRFELRDDAKWCDGSPVRASDFVRGMRRAVDPETAAPFSALLSPVENAEAIIAGKLLSTELGVTAIDETKLEIRTSHSAPWLLRALAHSVAAPIHAPSFARHGEAFARPGNLVGNGAYCLAEFRAQEYVRLDRNEHHWNVAEHDIETVYYHTVENLSAELSRYRAGEFDITSTVAPTELSWVRTNLPDELHEAPLLAAFYLGFNLDKPPFADAPGLRRALNLALDREQLVNVLFDGAADPAYTLVPPLPGYDAPIPAFANMTQAERLALARRLYRDAGYSSEKPLTVNLVYPTSSSLQRQMDVVAALWHEALGIEVKFDNMEWKVFLATQRAMRIPGLYRDGWIADYADANAFLELFVQGSPTNVYGFSSERYDTLVAAANRTVPGEERMRLLADAEEILLEDDVIVPLYFNLSRHLVKPRVEGWQPHPLDHHPTRFLRIRTSQTVNEP